ncbi:hypothetical protein [Frigoriflavimonas asaccharolytica]|uniref:Uncharacterized protein n=1 Tax=Frigoriflavimonas asaccharolytica TaxID=2735899 RepID=A0A8J8G9D1_9FLAO|nr:hypothetical protein [Frigoriflavimonas asaccharolytica]NRS93744.1 hypothetical protein [Frigoriflavimonas asaccharolytica]
MDRKIDIDTLNTAKNGNYTAYYLEFLDYELKQKLKKNTHLKINEVYAYYRNNGTVSFSVFSDEGNECVATQDIGGEYLSIPNDGKIKIIKPIKATFFRFFEVDNEILKVKKWYNSPSKEWYEDQNGVIENDIIHYTTYYFSKKYKYEKKLLATTNKMNEKIVYQPNLKAVKYKNDNNTYFIITGEFNVKK